MERLHLFTAFLPACLAVTLLGAAPGADKPTETIDDRVARLIEELGNDQYAVREHAQEELAAIGIEAFDALSAAESHEDLEIASRAKYLVRLIRVKWTKDQDSTQVKQLLKDYETAPPSARLAKIKALAELPDDEGLPALCRLVRFEPSAVLSKQAALTVMGKEPASEAARPERAKAIQAAMGRSTRAAAQWLRLFSDQAGSASADRWGELATAELAAIKATPEESQPAIAMGLLRRQVDLLRKEQRADEALAAMRRMLDLEKGEPFTLTEMINWLAEQQAWPVLDDLAKRFSTKIDENAGVLYTLASARQKQGDEPLAEKLAAQALELNPGDAKSHLQTAYRLHQEGMLEWSKGEYRQVVEHDADPTFSLLARFQLAELYHDLEEELAAAEVLQGAVDGMEKDPAILEKVQELGRTPESLRARMNYFYACHHQQQKSREKQIEHLELALRQDRTDADVLIGLYRISAGDPERRASVLKAIQQAASVFQETIAADPEDSTSYNQFAWLIGNTEGDFDEAIRCSHKSLELRPGTGGYLDTLAHCYFAKGDIDNAVKYQAQAVKLEPHTQQIRRALDRFQAAKAAAEPKETP